MSLKIYSVINASNPDEEVVRLSTDVDVNLKGYAVVDKTFNSDGNESNKFRHIFIFPDLAIKAGEFIRLYSGEGKYNVTVNANKARIHHFYWHSDGCVWNDKGDTARLIKFSIETTIQVPAVPTKK